jgi:hypothetical protein
MKIPTRLVLLLAGVPLIFFGCIERQMRKMEATETKRPQDVLQAAEDILKARYYQVRKHSPQHLVALTPMELNSNSYTRSRIDVYVFQENGFYMPNVYVRTYLDTAEPPVQTGPESPSDSAYHLTPRFPIEKAHATAPDDRWESLYYDRTLALEIRNAILERLKIPSKQA